MTRHLLVICLCLGFNIAARRNTLTTEADFSVLVNRYDFVDKTLFIKAVFDGPEKMLITVPHRSGKSAAADMLARFLQIEVDEEGLPVTRQTNRPVNDTGNYRMFTANTLNILKHKYIMKKHFGKHPLMKVDFKCITKFSTSEDAAFCFREVIHNTFVQHNYLRRSDKLTLKDKRLVKRWSYGVYDRFYGQDVTNSLYKLSVILHKHFDKKVFVVIDNYDFPSVSAMLEVKDSKELNRVVKFNMGIISKLMSGDYRYLERAVVFGLSHVAAAGVYPLEHVHSYRFLRDHPFVEYFGLTRSEVDHLFGRTVFNLTNRDIEKGHRTFNGYVSFKNKTIYSLNSILQFVSSKSVRNAYILTEFTKNLKWLFKIKTIREHIETLVKGGSIEVVMDDAITLDDMIGLRSALYNCRLQEHFNINLVFYFLMEQGFLSYNPRYCNTSWSSERAHLQVPNEQIKLALALKVKEYYDGIYRIDKTLLKKCASFFDSISPSALINTAHFKRALYWFYKSLEQLVSGIGNRFGKMLEGDVHRIIFSMLYQVNFRGSDSFTVSVSGSKNHVDILLVKDTFSVVMEFRVNSTSQIMLESMAEKLKNTTCPRTKHKCILFTIGIDQDLHLSVSCMASSTELTDAIHVPE